MAAQIKAMFHHSTAADDLIIRFKKVFDLPYTAQQ